MYLFEAPQQDMNVKREASPKSSPEGKDLNAPSLQGGVGDRHSEDVVPRRGTL